MVGKARRKTRAVSFAECVNLRVGVFPADLTVVVAMSGAHCHFGFSCAFANEAPAIVGAGGLGTDGPGPGAAIRGAPILKTQNPRRRFETSTGA
jgi:hypothetical protein